MPDTVREVPSTEWLGFAEGVHTEGAVWFDWLGAVDEVGRADVIRIMLRVAPGPGTDGTVLQTTVPRACPELDSLRSIWAGAAWHEREVRDFFGVTFLGGDNRPLLLRPDTVGHPLRKDAVLAARVVRAWPGAKGSGDGSSGARRRMVPPGVPDPEVWGDRNGPPAPAQEVASSLSGGRVRRRR